MGTARENPFKAAAAVGGAVAAGVFLWSRRNQISDQISNLADQISDWREGMASDNDVSADEDGNDATFIASSGTGSRGGRKRRGQTEIAEEALTLKETGNAA